MFVNEVFLEHRQLIHLYLVCGCFCTTKIELLEYSPHSVKYHLALHRSLLTLA